MADRPRPDEPARRDGRPGGAPAGRRGQARRRARRPGGKPGSRPRRQARPRPGGRPSAAAPTGPGPPTDPARGHPVPRPRHGPDGPDAGAGRARSRAVAPAGGRAARPAGPRRPGGPRPVRAAGGRSPDRGALRRRRGRPRPDRDRGRASAVRRAAPTGARGPPAHRGRGGPPAGRPAGRGRPTGGGPPPTATGRRRPRPPAGPARPRRPIRGGPPAATAGRARDRSRRRGRDPRRRCPPRTCSAPTRSWSPAAGRSRRSSPPAAPRIACWSSRSAANALEQLVLHATRLRIPIVEVEGGSLTALAGFDGHQGVALVVEPRRFASLDDVLARAAERGEPPFVLVLDSLEDPQNVGTLLRSAEAAGVHGVVFPTRRQAPLTPGRGQGLGRRRRAPAALPGRRPAGRPGRPPRARAPDRRLGGGRAADRAPDRPARPARHRRRQRGPGPRAGRPATLRPVHADPDARRDRLAQRRRGRVRPAVRGRRPARPGGPPGAADAADPSAADRPIAGRHRRSDAGAGRPTRRPVRAAPDDAGPPTRRRRRPVADAERRPPARRAAPPAGGHEAAEAAGARAPPTLDPSDRPALSFPGADGVICGMALRVAPT